MSLIAITRETPPRLARCRSCDAAIEWVETAAGARMPVDAPLVVARTYLRGDGRDQVLIEGGGSHFVTCPDAAQHRRRGRG